VLMAHGNFCRLLQGLLRLDGKFFKVHGYNSSDTLSIKSQSIQSGITFSEILALI
jgi:hypothetical protein